MGQSLQNIYPTNHSYNMVGAFIKKLHVKLKDNGLEAKIDSFEQAGFPGCFTYRLNIPETICESYGDLSHHLSGAIFDSNPLYTPELTTPPHLDAIINKLACPELVRLISENVKYFEISTNAEINQDLSIYPGSLYSRRSGKTDAFSLNKRTWSLRVSYEFVQENDNLVEELSPCIKRNPLLKLWQKLSGN